MSGLTVELKKYLEAEPNGGKVPAGEFMAFYKALTPEDKAAARAELKSYGIDVDEPAS